MSGFPWSSCREKEKETLRLFGDPYAVAHVCAAMFNAAIRWQPFEL
jgi:hypothetical protein